MSHIDPPPPRNRGRAAALIILAMAVIIAILFIGRDVWLGDPSRPVVAGEPFDKVTG